VQAVKVLNSQGYRSIRKPSAVHQVLAIGDRYSCSSKSLIPEGLVMRKWGFLITAFYVSVILFFLLPLTGFLAEYDLGDSFTDSWPPVDGDFFIEVWPAVIWIAVLILGQMLLLFLSVDTSFRRIQQRRHIGVSIATVALMVGMLTGVAIWSVIVAISGDEAFDNNEVAWSIGFLAAVALSWLCWTFVFRTYKVGDSERLNKLIGWLIKGSILELLIVVPCHVIVRQRGDCSAPLVTGFGISTGIAVMLLAFGPSILYLYQKRLASYKAPAKSSQTDDESDEPQA
jgi:hypothetical protein